MWTTQAAAVLALCSLTLLSANAQQNNCPDFSEELCGSSDPCRNGARCPRFFNSECRTNTCNGLCQPNFFFRGRNVTDRCGSSRICATRTCSSRRVCVEEIVESCNRNGRCRQRLVGRCRAQPVTTTQQPSMLINLCKRAILLAYLFPIS